MTCKDCVHDGICYLQEVTNDIDEQLKEFGCEDFKNKVDFVEIVHAYWTKNHKCSNCKEFALTSNEAKTSYYHAAFCPFCGAEMDGGKK